MDPSTLMAFIQRIIATSPDQRAAQQALQQLYNIVTAASGTQGKTLLDTALRGVERDFHTMATDLPGDADMRTLSAAAAHAEQVRADREAAERYGRC